MTVGPTTNGWHVALRTEAGRREGNQDSVLSMRLADGGIVVAVADGMGGLELGDVASRTALETLRNEMRGGSTLDQAVRRANRAVHDRAGGRPMGTTLVVAHARGNRVEVANVGDSRAYRLTPLGMVRVTVDHTHAEAARREGGEFLDATGRWGAALTRSLGAGPEVEPDLFGPFEVEEGEGLLLCSDGVHGVLDDAAIEEWSQQRRDPEQAVDRLLELALTRGSDDNLSAVLLLRRAPLRAGPTAARRTAPAWDPRVLVERSPVQARKRGGWGLRIVAGVLFLVLVAALAAAWFVTR